MCSINHDKKAIFIHITKTGGTYIHENLTNFYGFKHFLITRPDHESFCNIDIQKNNIDYYEEKIIPYNHVANRKHGFLKYFKTSNYINRMMNMNEENWNTYKIFCFIRNPYDRIISGWNYINNVLEKKVTFENFIEKIDNLSDFEYFITFMSQFNNMIDENNKFRIDYLGKFENLEEDFQNILLNIGFKKEEIIHDKDKINNFEYDSYYNIINSQYLLDKVNEICKEDFEKFHYQKIKTYEEFIQIKPTLI